MVLHHLAFGKVFGLKVRILDPSNLRRARNARPRSYRVLVCTVGMLVCAGLCIGLHQCNILDSTCMSL